MWQIKKLPFYIDLIFCLVLLPAMMTLLPIERWLINNSLFVYLLVSWLYIVYILNRRFIMPFMFAGKKRFWIAVSLILLTAVGTYLITRYQMEVPLHHMRRTRLLQHIPKIKLQQQAVWFLYVVVIAFSAAVGLLTQLYHQIMERQAVEFEKKKAERDIRLKELGYTSDDLKPHYYCPLCKDTGTVNGEDCVCLKELEYAQLRAGSLGVPTEADAFDENLLKGIPESMRPSYSKAYAILAKYAADFPDNKISVIGLCGPVGCGKSFAAGVLANAVMRKGYSVLFINAVQLNELFLRYHRAPVGEKADIFSPLKECDLIVIDDLGAEPLFNNVTANYLYGLLSSEREGRFVITTNLDFDSLRSRYGDGQGTLKILFARRQRSATYAQINAHAHNARPFSVKI